MPKKISLCPAWTVFVPVIACDKRKAFAQGSEATKQSNGRPSKYGLLRGACLRAALCADPMARNDGVNCCVFIEILKSDTAWR
jgi:hypothetical protein